jgi:hypothetical protein
MENILIKTLRSVVADKPSYNLPDLLVMVDCEMTGVIPTKDNIT